MLTFKEYPAGFLLFFVLFVIVTQDLTINILLVFSIDYRCEDRGAVGE